MASYHPQQAAEVDDQRQHRLLGQGGAGGFLQQQVRQSQVRVAAVGCLLLRRQPRELVRARGPGLALEGQQAPSAGPEVVVHPAGRQSGAQPAASGASEALEGMVLLRHRCPSQVEVGASEAPQADRRCAP